MEKLESTLKTSFHSLQMRLSKNLYS